MCIKIGLDVLWEEQVMLRIREAEVEDLPEMLAIYNYAIKNWTATFDLEEQTLDQRRIWFNLHGDEYPLIVAEVDGTVAGYCSLSPFKDKKAYEKTVEISIYLSEAYHGFGIGKKLIEEIISRAEQLNYHTIIAVITGGNKASVKLHEKFGFEFAGCLKEVGYKFGEWLDVCYYQLRL
jgi:L-amino acid N-acyltransferase